MNCEYCGSIPSVRIVGGASICVDCVRKQHLCERLVVLAPLVAPTGDEVIILPDADPAKTGRIIIPELYRGNRQEFGTGLVLAIGPGKYELRKPMSPSYMGTRAPMYSSVRSHVMWRAKHREAYAIWRKLVIVHDFDVLAEIEQEERQEEVA